MPRKQIDYKNTIIYKIVCKDMNVTDFYVGHTTDFHRRKQNHKSDCNSDNSKQSNLKIYDIIRKNGGWENWDMIEIEKFPCNDSNEATTRERFYYDKFKTNIIENECKVCENENTNKKQIKNNK